MEGRMKKYRQVSPERAKVWTEKSPRYHQQQPPNRKVAIVYYLCRNRQLEHPHFIEVTLSSPEGLYLKGRFSPAENIRSQNLKQLPEPAFSRSQDDSPSSGSMIERETKHSQDDDLSPPFKHSGSSVVSPESKVGKSSCSSGSLSLTEYKIYKTDWLANASTQTEENGSQGNKPRETCTRGVSTDDGALVPENNVTHQNEVSHVKETSEICRDSISPPVCSSSASSSGGEPDTLASLIRADASKMNSFRTLEEEEFCMPSHSKLKASNMLMQLISCGSISVKDHNFGVIPNYRPGISHSKFPSPLFSTSVMFGELNCLSENPRLMGLRLEDKEQLSGSLVETSMLKEGVPTLKRSSSYNADRNCEQLDSGADKVDTDSSSKCIPRSIKASLGKQPKSESPRSPNSDAPRISSDGIHSSSIISPSISNGGSKRITETVPGTKQSKRLESVNKDEENVIKIEERLASGARVIIHSKAPCDAF